MVSLNQAITLFSQGKDKYGNPILLPLFSVSETSDVKANVQIMANCRLVMTEGRAAVLVNAVQNNELCLVSEAAPEYKQA